MPNQCSICGQFHDDNVDECPNYYLKDFERASERVRPLFEFPPIPKEEPKLIKDWAELKECTSPTHELEIDVEGGNGWIRRKGADDSKEYPYYLSTHTFYGGQNAHSTKILQERGFNVVLVNWDEIGY